jgi:hypothetical protein
MYYRNNFFHIGHLKTLYDNDRLAKLNNGICYAVIDDRLDSKRIASIQEDFDYLELKHIKIISVKSEHPKIIAYTFDLIRQGHIYVYHCDERITQPDKIIKIVTNPRIHIQLRLNCGLEVNDPAIGYTNEDENGQLSLVLLFDFIIKVLDVLLGVACITNQHDTCDVKDTHIAQFFDKIANITHHQLSTYHIYNFRYSKRGWEVDESNPYLLTIKGLKARHVPCKVLKAFYLHACQMKSIKIQFLATLLNKYLFKHSEHTLGVIKPIKVNILNWTNKLTEYVCGPVNHNFSRNIKHYPLSDVMYVDTSDYGIEQMKINKGRTIPLIYGPSIKCMDINLQDHHKPELSVRVDFSTHAADTRKITWISAAWDEQPCQVKFYLYNWFYTGFNNLLTPEVVEGYIDSGAFNDLDQIYQIEHIGYFAYDRKLTAMNGVPTFMRICKI